MKERSNRPEVRNPMASIPEVQALAELLASLPPDVGTAVRTAFRGISNAARERGDQCWKKHKAPMAAYWKGKAVDFRHLAVILNRTTP